MQPKLSTFFLIGAGMATLPLTSFGLSGVDSRDSGAASGLINVAQQTGYSLGLAILITVFEAVNRSASPSKQQFAHAISVSITGSVIFLTAALVVVLLLFLPARRTVQEQARNVA